MPINEDGSMAPIKVSLVDISDPVQSRLIPTRAVARDKVLILNTYPMTLGALPVNVLSHSPKRCMAHIVVNGSGIVAFGASQSDVQNALVGFSGLPGEYTGDVAFVNAAELQSSMQISGNTELWAGLAAATDPMVSPVTPATPATGVAVQNPNPYPVQVVIGANGATITNVTVNGLTVGTAAGTYFIPAFGTISVAYTVATPTMAWTNATLAIPTTVAAFKEINT
jgi:hypothetical protein